MVGDFLVELITWLRQFSCGQDDGRHTAEHVPAQVDRTRGLSSRSRGANRTHAGRPHKSQDRLGGLRSRERELSEGQLWSLTGYSSGHVDLDALSAGAGGGVRSIRAPAGPNPARS